MIHILHGANDLLRDERLAELRAAHGKSEEAELNTVILDGSTATFDTVAAACNTLPFFTPKRLVIIKGLMGRMERGDRRAGRRVMTPDEEKKESEWKPLRSMLGVMPLSTDLIFVEGILSRSNPVLSELSSLASIQEFYNMRGAQFDQWLSSRFVNAGAKITPEAQRQLSFMVGANMRQLQQEVDKLATYASGRTITEEDVALMIPDAKEGNIFAMVDAIIDGHSGQALRMAHKLQDEGMSVQQMLAMVARQARLLIQAKALSQKKVDDEELASRLGITSDFVFKKTMEQTRRRTHQQMAALLGQLLDIDISIKRGQLSEDTAMDVLIAGAQR